MQCGPHIEQSWPVEFKWVDQRGLPVGKRFDGSAEDAHADAMAAKSGLCDFGAPTTAQRRVLFGDIADTGMSRDIADT